MRKTITITDPMQVEIGDKAYFKDCDFGFDVIDVNRSDTYLPFEVMTPLSDSGCWVQSPRFDYAIRVVKDSEWPDPHDIKLHVYLGADGRRYIYNPCSKDDIEPWTFERNFSYFSRENMEEFYPDALPLTELKLVPVKDDGSNNTGITIVGDLKADPEKHTTRRK